MLHADLMMPSLMYRDCGWLRARREVRSFTSTIIINQHCTIVGISTRSSRMIVIGVFLYQHRITYVVLTPFCALRLFPALYIFDYVLVPM